jgi:ribokinase
VSVVVVVVGSINVDLVVRVPHLPEPGETVIGGTFTLTHGGKGANQAVAAARLGAITYMVGAVGDDDFGRQARFTLLAEGVDVSWVKVSSKHTGVAQVIVDQRGENLIAIASGANSTLNAGYVQQALGALPARRGVVLCNLEIPLESVIAAARAAREKGCLFVLNPAPAMPLPAELLRLCDVLTPNEHEVQALGKSSVAELLEEGVGAVVVTRGGQGADLLVAGEPVHHQPAFPIEVVDTTGAGDAFTGTLGWALAGGRTLQEAVRLAAAGGALATRRLGARSAMATRAELEALASSEPV